MSTRRSALFWGLFLLLLGGIPLLVRAGVLDSTVFADAWRLWPLILVAIGLAIILGRRRGVAITAILALTLGTIAGGALASGNVPLATVGDCVATQASMERTTQDGLLETPASVRLDMDCGELHVTTATTASWSLAADHLGAPPTVAATGSSLRIAAPTQTGAHRQVWTLELPAVSARDIDTTANAAAGTFDLRDMTLDRFRAEVNAGDIRLDASRSRITRVEVSINAGRARVTLGTGSTQGSLAANAGALDLCVPPSAALILRVPDQLTFAHNLERRGLTRDGDTWRRAGTSGDTIDLRVEGNAASFTLDPDGGC